MALLGHLTEEDIRRSIAEVPDIDRDRHVRLCAYCAQRLSDASQRAACWERRGLLGRLVRVDTSRLVEELLAEIEADRPPRAA